MYSNTKKQKHKKYKKYKKVKNIYKVKQEQISVRSCDETRFN